MMMVKWWWYVQDTEVKVKLLEENEKTCVHNTLVILETGVLQQKKRQQKRHACRRHHYHHFVWPYRHHRLENFRKRKSESDAMHFIKPSFPCSLLHQKSFRTFSCFRKSKVAREREGKRANREKRRKELKPFSFLLLLLVWIDCDIKEDDYL